MTEFASSRSIHITSTARDEEILKMLQDKASRSGTLKAFGELLGAAASGGLKAWSASRAAGRQAPDTT
jgi:hypothetical protein